MHAIHYPRLHSLPGLGLVILVVGTLGQSALAFTPIFPETLHCTPDSRIVKSCFNIYMEKDVEEIMGIMTYSGGKSKCTPDGKLENTGRSDTIYTQQTKDIPRLVEQCTKIRDVYRCLESELDLCDELNLFFFLRHVLYSMELTIQWMCGNPDSASCPSEHLRNDQFVRNRTFFGDENQLTMVSKSHKDNMHQEVQERFSVLLENVHCMECLRLSNNAKDTCYNGSKTLAGGSHIWLQILRLERGPEICYELQKQLNCLWGLPTKNCDDHTDVYKNVINIFVNTWCDKHPFRSSNSTQQQFQQYIILAGLFFYFVLH